MRAVIYTQYGPPEVATLSEVDKPIPKSDELLIKVHATTVNRTDCGFRSASYFIVRFFAGLFSPKHKILGCEFAGEIESVGANVKTFRVGDKVFGFNDKKFGGHAEYLTISENAAIATMPSNVSFIEAAAMTEGSHYAWCDIRAAKITSGQQILVNGATGAIGSAAVQILKYLKTEVTAVCHRNNVPLVASLGADRVIDYTSTDFTTLDKTFDVVFDAVGKSSFGKCKGILKIKGIYLSTELGRRSENPFLALVTPLTGGKKVLFPIPDINKQDVLFLKELVENNKFRPVIDRTYQLSEIVEAYRYVETGQKIGNVVIDMTKK